MKDILALLNMAGTYIWQPQYQDDDQSARQQGVRFSIQTSSLVREAALAEVATNLADLGEDWLHPLGSPDGPWVIHLDKLSQIYPTLAGQEWLRGDRVVKPEVDISESATGGQIRRTGTVRVVVLPEDRAIFVSIPPSPAGGEAPDDAGAGPVCDVFICHASEDKVDIVEPLLSSLNDSGISTWYDRDKIRWGDSVVGRINEGLRHCRFVLVVLSENFLAKPWAHRELESALGEEASSGKLRVLPLLVGSKSQRSRVLGRFPLLADKKYLVWSTQHHEIAVELRSLLENLAP